MIRNLYTANCQTVEIRKREALTFFDHFWKYSGSSDNFLNPCNLCQHRRPSRLNLLRGLDSGSKILTGDLMQNAWSQPAQRKVVLLFPQKAQIIRLALGWKPLLEKFHSFGENLRAANRFWRAGYESPFSVAVPGTDVLYCVTGLFFWCDRFTRLILLLESSTSSRSSNFLFFGVW